MQNNPKIKNNTAIYCRLSVEDGDSNISQSITNQRNILTKYCLEHNFNIYNIYIDDGFSGTNFDRPGFKRLKEDIESGFINIVITKDLSRLGRDYLKVGELIENFFPDHNVRYIAIADNVDTKNQVDDFMPFKNIINEFYAKDISKKIRATHKYLMETGAIRKAGVALYGYMYDEKSRRVLNPDTAPNVVKIFDLFLKGYSISNICKELEKSEILTPLNYDRAQRGRQLGINPYKWIPNAVTNILKNKEYQGDYIRGKTSKRFKSKKITKIPVENQHVFKKMFDPIISEEVFNIAQTMFVGNKDNSGLTNPYAGIVYCGVCGMPLRMHRHKGSNGCYEERLVCKNSNEIGKGSILIGDLDLIIKKELLRLKEIILENLEEFSEKALAKIETLNINIPTSSESIMKLKIEQRILEIDKYIKNLFEESINQNLPTDIYQKMLNEYNFEKKELEVDLHKCELLEGESKDLSKEEQKEVLGNFIASIDTLDEDNFKSAMILRNLISKIMITTFKQEDNKAVLGKNITIYYRFCDSLIKSFMEEE